jgi:hypothetical protein
MIQELLQCFLLESPWLFFIVLITIIPIFITAIGRILNNLFYNLPLRFMRYLIIRKHVYPPPHCDADGDFVDNISVDDGRKK